MLRKQGSGKEKEKKCQCSSWWKCHAFVHEIDLTFQEGGSSPTLIVDELIIGSIADSSTQTCADIYTDDGILLGFVLILVFVIWRLFLRLSLVFDLFLRFLFTFH